ncbi:bifunctional metallophosphatase/5'-nucleotidase [bacterium]|nr:bifunctional metallophosphatase/5'-nucleotidase [bacterium]
MRRLMLAVLFLLLALSAVHAQDEPQPELEILKLGIIHTNDTHGHLEPFKNWDTGEDNWGGVAKRRVAIQRARADTDYYWLVLDAGDVFQGTPISNLLTGFLDLECMNQMGYDAMCLGNHEFDFGYELLRGRFNDVNFDMLCANVIDRERGVPVAKPYTILRRGDYRIGIIGLTTETLLNETHPSAQKSVVAYPAQAVASSLAKYLRSAGCDIVIALAHEGINRDRAMAQAVPELDVIVGGHTHTVLTEPEVYGNVVVTQDGEWGKTLGVLKLTFIRPVGDPDARFELAEASEEFVPLGPDAPEDDGLVAFIADYQRRFEAEMGKFVCVSGQDFPDAEVRLAECALADLICDAMLGQVDADCALFNGGNFRAPLYAGDVNFGDLYAVLPYDNFMMNVPLTGVELRDVLSYAGQQYGDGGFPQVGGMSVVYVDMQLAGCFIGENAPTEFQITWHGDTPVAIPMDDYAQVILGETGEMTYTVSPDAPWHVLDDTREYRLLTNDFLATGGDGFPLHEDPYGAGYTGLEQRATFALWASQQRELTKETDGRVQFIWENLENPGLRD